MNSLSANKTMCFIEVPGMMIHKKSYTSPEEKDTGDSNNNIGLQPYKDDKEMPRYRMMEKIDIQ